MNKRTAYVFTKDLGRALSTTAALECGSVCVNGAHDAFELPHGGLKQSGDGKDVSHLALDDFFDTKRGSIRTA